MEKLKEGSKVTCGICSKETTVSIVTERDGVAAYDLVCWHRNAICSKCGELVRDASEVLQEIHPHCEKCDGPYYDDDDKDDE